MDRKVYEECGCTHDGDHWLALCPQHEEEFTTRHLQAAEDHRRQAEEAEKTNG